MKEAGEYTGAHVLSMVRAHYPLIDLKRLEAGYPKEVDPDKASSDGPAGPVVKDNWRY